MDVDDSSCYCSPLCSLPYRFGLIKLGVCLTLLLILLRLVNEQQMFEKTVSCSSAFKSPVSHVCLKLSVRGQ